MTDKQIIIDGVDVSGCKNLMQGIVPFGCMEDRRTCSCMNNPNCLYKQLKRKEQECNELKKANIHIDNNRMVKSNKLKKIEEYCREQNLKADYTACEILEIIDEVE